jgi:hypothetical protein
MAVHEAPDALHRTHCREYAVGEESHVPSLPTRAVPATGALPDAMEGAVVAAGASATV